MSQYNDTSVRAFECDEAIPQYSRVKLDSDGKVTIAGLADKEIGTALEATFAAGEICPVRLRTANGTHKMIAVEALAVGATVYTEAAGKVQDTAASTAFQLGTAITAATADGDVIEVIYNAHGDTAVS